MPEDKIEAAKKLMRNPLSPPEEKKGRVGGRPRKWKRTEDGRVLRGTPLDDLVPPRGTEKALNPYREFALEKPEVSTYLARVIIGCEMDYDRAVIHLRKFMPYEERIELAVKLENDAHVQNAIKRMLEAVGIDDASRAQFIKQIWSWFYGDDEDKALAASRVLTRVFFGEQRVQEKVDDLKIEGFDAGLEKMFGKAPTQQPQRPAPEVGDEIIKTDALYLMAGKEE